MKKWIFVLVLICSLFTRAEAVDETKFVTPEQTKIVTQAKPYKNPTLSGLFSLVLPGSGHAYQGEWTKGSLFFGTEGVALTSFFLIEVKDNTTFLINDFSWTAAQNTHFYNVYSAYQDARVGNKNKNYNTPIAKHSLWDLMKAPFSWEYLKRWTFLLPTSAGIALNFYQTYRERDHIEFSADKYTAIGIPYFTTTMTGVGIGEESFFRGFLQPELTDLFGTPWVGVIGQSLFFGPIHIEDHIGDAILPTIFGLYFGWQTHRNSYDLRESVATHMWWNLIMTVPGLFYKDKDFVFSLGLPW